MRRKAKQLNFLFAPLRVRLNGWRPICATLTPPSFGFHRHECLVLTLTNYSVKSLDLEHPQVECLRFGFTKRPMVCSRSLTV